MVQKVTEYHSYSKRVWIRMYEPELAPLMTTVMKEIPETYVKALIGEYTKDKGLPVEIMAFGPSPEKCLEICDKAVERLIMLALEKGQKITEIVVEEDH